IRPRPPERCPHWPFQRKSTTARLGNEPLLGHKVARSCHDARGSASALAAPSDARISPEWACPHPSTDPCGLKCDSAGFFAATLVAVNPSASSQTTQSRHGFSRPLQFALGAKGRWTDPRSTAILSTHPYRNRTSHAYFPLHSRLCATHRGHRCSGLLFFIQFRVQRTVGQPGHDGGAPADWSHQRRKRKHHRLEWGPERLEHWWDRH